MTQSLDETHLSASRKIILSTASVVDRVMQQGRGSAGKQLNNRFLLISMAHEVAFA